MKSLSQNNNQKIPNDYYEYLKSIILTRKRPLPAFHLLTTEAPGFFVYINLYIIFKGLLKVLFKQS